MSLATVPDRAPAAPSRCRTRPAPAASNNAIFQTENQIPIVANGQRTSQNNFEIDGVSVNSLTWGGAAVVTPNQESVKSVRVASSEYSAEAGRNSGAQIQVVSQNGTNQFHGSGVFKYNDPIFNAFNKFGGPNGAPPVRVQQFLRQFAASVGGPIVKNKLFFFFSYEGLRQGNTNFTDYLRGNARIPAAGDRRAARQQHRAASSAALESSRGSRSYIPAACPAGFAAGTCRQVLRRPGSGLADGRARPVRGHRSESYRQPVSTAFPTSRSHKSRCRDIRRAISTTGESISTRRPPILSRSARTSRLSTSGPPTPPADRGPWPICRSNPSTPPPPLPTTARSRPPCSTKHASTSRAFADDGVADAGQREFRHSAARSRRDWRCPTASVSARRRARPRPANSRRTSSSSATA